MQLPMGAKRLSIDDSCGALQKLGRLTKAWSGRRLLVVVSLGHLALAPYVCAQDVASDSIPPELQGEPWQQIVGQIRADEHRLRKHNGAWRANTPRQRYSTRFGEDGPIITIYHGDEAHDLAFRLTAAEVDGKPIELAGAESVAQGNRFEYRRGALTEWYVNRGNGLEQGFTIERAPPGETLRIALHLDTALATTIRENALVLGARRGPQLRYAGLAAWDADQRSLPTRLRLEENVLVVETDVADAAYPVTVDPTLVNESARLIASGPSAGDLFGAAVSLDGNRVLVGASGSVYVFHFDGVVWNQEAKLLADDGDGGDIFGASVSLDGNRALVGAWGDDDNGDNSGSAYVFHFDGETWSQEAKLLADDGDKDDLFGESVSLSGNRALVGAVWDDDYGSSSGSAYVFHFDGVVWNQEAKLLADDGDEGDGFGGSVSLDGNRVIVGARQDHNNGDVSGSAYVFRFGGETWSQEAKLLADDGDEGDRFGESVSLDGNRALVGAYQDDDNGADSGSAYVFERDASGNWVQVNKLLAGDGDEGDRFGESVSLDGNRALAGARFDDDNGSNSGSAYVFRFNDGAWPQETKMLPSDGAPGDLFGFSASVSGERALIGAPFADIKGVDSGAAYVFDRVDTAWQQITRLSPSGGSAGDRFGFSVSLSGERALIGAPEDDDNGNESGSAYIFELVGDEWQQIDKLIASNGGAGDRLGEAASLSGDRALVGVPGDNVPLNADNAGSAYLFEFDGQIWNETKTFIGFYVNAGDGLGEAVSISADRVLLGAPGHDDGGQDAGAAFVFTFDGEIWSQPVKLTASDGAAGDDFGEAVSLDGDRALIGASDHDVGEVDGAGAAYVFDFDGAEWIQSAMLTASDAATADDIFGISVSLEGDRVLVGAPGVHDNGEDSGAAYTFTFDGQSWIERYKLLPSDGASGDLFGWSASLSGDAALLGAVVDNVNGADSGSAYVFDLNRSDLLFTDRFENEDTQ